MPRTKNDERHNAIAFGALQAILDKGVSEFTMSDIGKCAGVKRSLLYWYFPRGVSDALAAAAAVAMQGRSDFVQRRLASVKHPVIRLDTWLCASLAFHDDGGQLARIMAAAGVGLLSQDQTRSALADGLRAGMTDGRVATCDADSVVDLCATAADGALICAQSEAALRALQAMRLRTLLPLHTGDWMPALLRGLPPTTRMVRSPAGACTAAPESFEKPVTRSKRQVVIPRGDWLELD